MRKIYLRNLRKSVPDSEVNFFRVIFDDGDIKLKNFEKTVTIFLSKFSIMRFGFIFEPTKFEFLFVFKFVSVVSQNVDPETKTNIFRVIFTHRENQNEGALENQDLF